MTKLRNLTRVSDYFKIDPTALQHAGAVNAILECDNKYFIDPLSLATCSDGLFSRDAFDSFNTTLKNVFELVRASRRKGDPAWQGAYNLFGGREFSGIGLGYGNTRSTGSSLDRKVAEQLLSHATDFINLGIDNPDLFLLMPLLIPGVGADSISDITARSIRAQLAQYTESIFMPFDRVQKSVYKIDSQQYRLPNHPFQNDSSPLLLVPSEIVTELPIASSWDEVARVCQSNADLRTMFDEFAAEVFKSHATKRRRPRRSYPKHEALSRVSISREIAERALDIVSRLKHVDFEGRVPVDIAVGKLKDDDRVSSCRVAPPHPPSTARDVVDIVLKIIEEFRFLIEDRRMSELLYREDGSPFPELLAQRLFFLVAHSHCRAWDLDITPEAETGNGPVDFKFSKGFHARVVVEIKLSTNSSAVHGFNSQLKRYSTAEIGSFGIFMFLDVGRSGNKWREIHRSAEGLDRYPIYIDARRKPSASKLRGGY